MADTKKIEWLSWRGYSTNKRMDLSGWNEGFAYPSASLRKIPYCAESFTYLNGLDYKARVDKQKSLFESVDHSAMSCIYMGIIKPDELYWIQEQVARCIKAMLELVQATTMGDINGGRLNELLNKMSPDKAAYLKSALQSSLYFYSNKTANNPFINILNQPLYMELGVDLLANNLKYMLSEFQVRYMTPFPHLLTDLSHGYEKILPEIFKKFQLSHESFEKRRDDQLNTVIEQFEKGLAGGNTLSRVLVDAWC